LKNEFNKVPKKQEGRWNVKKKKKKREKIVSSMDG